MIERTVNFDDKNSETDYGIIFEAVTIGAPEPQISLVDVPFRNGVLDVTDNFGGPKYKNRTISLDFRIPWWSEEQISLYSDFLNDVNGERKKITFSADDEWYYYGRVKVGDASIEDGWWCFSVEVDADPFKYKDVHIVRIVRDTAEFDLENGYSGEIPTFFTTAPVILEFESNSYTLSGGERRFGGIVLKKGSNPLVVRSNTGGQGSPTLTIKYRQGRL